MRWSVLTEVPLRWRGYAAFVFFESGTAVSMLNWPENPTEVGPYSQIWIAEADGTRTLLVDPKQAKDVVTVYHQFDKVVGADLDWDWPARDTLTVSGKGEDGIVIELDLSLLSPRPLRVASQLLRTTPEWLAASRFGIALNSAVGRLLGMGAAARSFGYTETGRAFLWRPEQLAWVSPNRAELRGESLGAAIRPKQPVYWGDGGVDAPIFLRGGLRLAPIEA